ncbi:GNAT family N-acetyltransferase [Tuberibacillus sp. Marseille-P3662]|uniref:GNAT family N-acetyltransferase n=1 Tax=Tuberibacillus sp. Marseille-P3662 TaxID=1965358 RepID=UPI000A1CCFC1|nr:GNAT family N-acetyltransferase [Tuberibacillus sp. Marseille-P3662]
MIRQLSEEDRQACSKLVQDRPAENLFIIGDLEAYGFDESFQDVWGDFDKSGQMRGILLRYRDNFIPYAPAAFDAKGFAAIIDQDTRDHKILSGIAGIVEQVMPYLESLPTKTRDLYYAKCEQLEPLKRVSADVRQGSIDDVPAILKLHEQIPEFEAQEGRGESLSKNIETGVARIYYVNEGDTMVSSAMTTAENSQSAMIVGVCTLDEYKKQGYATSCMVQLCRDLLAEGKELCLFYDNPDAGNIYKRLGFKDIDRWVMNDL